MKLQDKMLSKLQSQMFGFNNAKVKPSQEIITSRTRVSQKVPGVEAEVMG